MKLFRLRYLLLLLAMCIAGTSIYVTTTSTHAAPVAAVLNQNCTLKVPAAPLTAVGLATPYQLVATDAAAGPCNEANAAQAAFVQAGVYDPATKTVSIYNPLVIDAGTTPAVAPVVPALPVGATVAIWFGFNGNVLTLQGAAPGELALNNCVNGLPGSPFGQFAYCNAVNFFAAALPNVATPALGVSPVDGMTCPTVRHFSIVDQDQSDNVTSTYLVTAAGTIAQNNAVNAAMGVATLKNASDNRLLTLVDAAIGCAPFMAPDLGNAGAMTTGLPLDELQAAQHQVAPIARVPSGDPMVLVNGHANGLKRTLYRLGVGQNIFANPSTVQYCRNLLNVAPNRIFLDRAATMAAATPDGAVGNSLFTFIASRFETAFGPAGLNCTGLLHVAQPITVIRNGAGVAIDATHAPNPATAPKHKNDHEKHGNHDD